MSSDVAVRVEHLSKTYRSYPKPIDRLLEWLTRRRRHVPFHALADVSFTLPRGESLGIVGENGAGKSTLLKILSGVSRPTSGEVQVNGRIASILELGSGFHPEFSGRDNIRINAALLGLEESRVHEKLPEILAFSELGEFIDRPVKVYSTGMTMRLAFSIATQVEPDVLIVDEALSVGDGYFQKKCMDRMVELVERGTTLLFCTHAMYYLTSFCHQAIWLRDGEVAAAGGAREVVAQYERFLQGKSREAADEVAASPTPPPAAVDETGAQPAEARNSEEVTDGEASGAGRAGRITALRVVECPHDRRADESAALAGRAQRLELEVDIHASNLEERFRLGIGIDRDDGTQLLSMTSPPEAAYTGRSEFTVRCVVPELPILQGSFSVYVFLLDAAGLHVWDQHVTRSAFERTPADYRIGMLELPYEFELVER